MRRVLAASLLVVGLAACGATRAPVGAPPPSTAPVIAPTITANPTTTAAAPVSLVAQAKVADLAVFAQPGDATPKLHLANPRQLGGPLVLLASDRRPGWIQALLPVRPNGSRGWVRDSDVTLSTHSFRITVELGAHRLTLYNGYAKVAEANVAVGAHATPTPVGLFYTDDFVKLDNPDGPYGAYAYGLSGFSDVLTSFGGGPGQIAIHGTDEPQAIGTDASHGCIRLRNEDVTRLAGILPLGVPVQISV